LKAQQDLSKRIIHSQQSDIYAVNRVYILLSRICKPSSNRIKNVKIERNHGASEKRFSPIKHGFAKST